MGSLSIALVCDADLCAKNPRTQKMREIMTIESAQKIHETYTASHE